MFKHTVTYLDFNDKEHVEDLYFHMMAPEFADLEFNPVFEGSLGAYVKDAMQSGEGRKVYTFFKMMIVNSYGRRSEDGARFTKRAEFTEEFLSSQAYENFFLWLTVEDPSGGHAQQFWNGIMPKKLEGLAQKELESQTAATPKKKVKDMTREELEAAFQAKLAEKKVIDAAL